MLPLFRHQTKSKTENDIKNETNSPIKILGVKDKIDEIWNEDGVNMFFSNIILNNLYQQCEKYPDNTDKILKAIEAAEIVFNLPISLGNLTKDQHEKIKETLIYFKELKEICVGNAKSSTISVSENSTFIIPKSQDVTSIFFIPVKDSDWILKPINKGDYRYYHKNNVGETKNKLREFENQGFGEGKRKANLFIIDKSGTNETYSYLGLFELDKGNKKPIYWRRIK